MAESKQSVKDLPDIKCYIHNVSPVKKSGSTKYFNYTVQTDKVTQNGVCFAVEKRASMDALAQQRYVRSPVKIQKYTISEKFHRQDVVVNKYTLVTPTTLDFEYKSQDNNLSSIASLSQVTAGQLVVVKGHLEHLSAIKTIVLQSEPIKKQEGFINDPSGYIKVVFWEDHTDTLKEGCTYLFNKLRVKVHNQEKYLNTPKNEDECTISLVEDFKDTLKPVENISASKELTANILGVTNINTYSSCCSCNKNVTAKGKIAFCNNCKMTMKLSSCNSQWFLKLFVQDSTKASNKIRLAVYNDMVKKLFVMCNIHTSATDDEVVENILELDHVKIVYDSQSNKLIDIDSINI